MAYTGDAFLTLKTKVQVNPLRTHLSTKPDFASPQPLAAASGLTIPLSITLSNFRLSGFVILVFSKQKGLTLVFRNDPLESLKVSSTFDSIPFVRDYLQKIIEGQLRVLFMEDLPAIIHRLSLRLCSPEFRDMEEERLDGSNDSTATVDPLATPAQDAVDAFGNPLDESQISEIALEPAGEIHASFSQKNILRLAALSESQRTLSLFTPGIRDAVFRAWAGPDREASGTTTPALTRGSLSRIQSTFGTMKSGASSVASGSQGTQDTHDTHDSRPTVSSTTYSMSGLTLGAGRSRTGGMRKRKKRVVDLRKKTTEANADATSADGQSEMASTYASETSSVMHGEGEAGEVDTPPHSPARPGQQHDSPHDILSYGEPSTLLDNTASTDTLLPAASLLSEPSRISRSKAKQRDAYNDETIKARPSSRRPPLSHSQIRQAQQSTSPLLRSLSFDKIALASPPNEAESSGGILEQAWMTKMAQEIARKVQQEKDRGLSSRDQSPAPRSSKRPSRGIWASEDELEAPPAYVA
ncbi:hypothetical protein OPT61_g7922 [Boeremia exigua]|uniref:Uncharacterized protein n=1 Tax=Boeremia exigua TaxID=749465 RepID=A0ACC2I0E2_9PLEO|nr:hypothetical protein OPT61_g7922 [Boeremia exigua]